MCSCFFTHNVIISEQKKKRINIAKYINHEKKELKNSFVDGILDMLEISKIRLSTNISREKSYSLEKILMYKRDTSVLYFAASDRVKQNRDDPNQVELRVNSRCNA